MLVSEIITETRTRLDDLVPDASGNYQFNDSVLIPWINEAQIEACRRGRFLSDSSYTQDISSGTATYTNPSGVIFIRRAKLASEERPLCFTSYKDMDEIAGWETHTGTPTHIFTDLDTDSYTLYPEPDAVDTLNITGIKEPTAITLVSQTPEIYSRFHYGLVDWCLYRAHSVRDADVYSPQKSLEHYGLFEQEYGPRSSAKDEMFQLRQRPYDNYDGTY